MSVIVSRSPATKCNWSDAGTAKVRHTPRGVAFEFRLPVPGGETDVECIIEPDSYAEIARHMMEKNPVAATRAFAKAIMHRDQGEKAKDAKPLW